jgi:hypothetical protein
MRYSSARLLLSNRAGGQAEWKSALFCQESRYGTLPVASVAEYRDTVIVLFFLRRVLPLAAFIVVFAASGSAGSVSPGPPSAQSILLGMQASDLELEYFGFNPSAFFFFTGNTNYQGNGLDEVEIIAAALNPAGATSLEGVTTHTVTFTVDDSGTVVQVTGLGSSVPLVAEQVSPVPEPAFSLPIGASVLIAAGIFIAGTRRPSQIHIRG